MRKVLTWLASLSFALAPALFAQTAFTPGDVFRVTANRVDRIPYGGGDFTEATPFATISNPGYGQIVWKPDLSLAYFTNYASGEIQTLAPDGSIGVFATGLDGPMGLVWTQDGRLLVAEMFADRVRDITPGGDVSAAPVFASGLPTVRSLLQTSDGRILATLQETGAVKDITAGGNFALAPVFADLPGRTNAIVEDPFGRIYVNSYLVEGGGGIFEISAGGDYNEQPAFVSGSETILGLAVAVDRLIAADNLEASVLRDVTEGGVYRELPAYATGLTGHPDTLMGAVPLPAFPIFTTRTTVLIAKGDDVPGAGGPIVAAGAKLRTVGIPALNDQGYYAFAGSWVEQRPRHGIFVQDAYTSEPTAEPIVAATGMPAPGVNNATFSTFREPLISESAGVAFLTTLSGPPSAQQQALFTNVEGELTLVAQAGVEAPGTEGATFKKIQSVSLGRTPEEGPTAVFFTASLTPGTGTPVVRRGNDFGLWVWRGGETSLLLRNGTMAFDGGESEGSPINVKFFSAITARRSGGTSTSGQGHGVERDGLDYLWTRIQTADGNRAIGYIDSEVGLSLEYQRGEEAPGYGPGTTFKAFNLPTQNTDTSGAFLAQVSGGGVNGTNNMAIFAEDEEFDLQLVVATGDEVYDVPGAVFSKLRDPVSAAFGRVGFTARLKGLDINATNDDALFLSEECGCSTLIAREGGQPAGVPQGAQWRAFTELALPEYPVIGPIFTAQMVVPKGGQPNPAQITRSNDTGFWMTDPFYQPHLAIREGQTMDVRGVSKVVRAFKPLAVVPSSPAQTRSHNAAGQIVYLVVFSDTSTAIVRSELTLPFEFPALTAQ